MWYWRSPTLAWLVVGCLLSPAVAGAQAPEEPAPPATPAKYRVAIVPFEVQGGRRGTQNAVDPTLRDVFQDEGFECVPGQLVSDCCQELNIPQQGLVPDTALLALGERLQARYVVAGSMSIRSKRTWHILGPRAKARVLIDTKIVDTEKRAVVFHPTDAGKTARHRQSAQTAVGVLVSLPLVLFMGGSRGKMERRALPKSLRAVYAEFFDSLEKVVGPIEEGAPAQEEPSRQAAPTGVVLLANGDKLTGTILSPEELSIETAYGTVTVKLREVSKITLATGDPPSDVLLLANGDQLSGKLQLSALSLVLKSGQKVELEREQIKSLEVIGPQELDEQEKE